MSRAVALVLIALCTRAVMAAPRDQWIGVLTDALQARGQWTSVHAAEALLQVGESTVVRREFTPQAGDAPAPYRIGVWRVLACCAEDDSGRQRYVERIRTVSLDANARDSVYAMESLAKLNVPMRGQAELSAVERIAAGSTDAAPFAAWRLAEANEPHPTSRLTELLKSPSAVTRARAADALRHVGSRSDDVRLAVSTALAHEPIDSPARPMLVAIAGGAPLRAMLRDASPGARFVAAMQIAQEGGPTDAPGIERLLDDPDSDVRVAAAFALLNIDRRNAQDLEQARHEDR